MRGLGQSFAHAGPEWATVALIAAFAVWKGVPLAEKLVEQHGKNEAIREQRKDRESRDRAEFERKSTELQGRWLAQYEHATDVQEQTNAVMEGVQAQMTTLNAILSESKDRSRTMAGEVHEMHAHIVHGSPTKGGPDGRGNQDQGK